MSYNRGKVPTRLKAGLTQQSARRRRAGRNHSCDILPKIPNHMSSEGTESDIGAFAIYVSKREYGKLLAYALPAA